MNAKIIENEVLQSLAEKYQNDGYKVIVEPDSDEIPFDLNGYHPDLLAIKEGLKLIIQSRRGLKRFSIERLQAISQLIAQHQGWRFVLVTLDDVVDEDELDAEKTYRSWEEIAKQTAQIPLIINAIGNNAALLYVWGICEAVLRRHALELAVPVERWPFTRLVKHFYTIGELSINELDTLLETHKQRNKVAHGFKTNVSRDILEQLINFISKYTHEWAMAA